MPEPDRHHTHAPADGTNIARIVILALVVLIIAAGVISVITAG